MPTEPLKATVVGREDHTSDLFVLKLKPQMPSGEKFVFKPGQYCTIGLSDDGGNPIKEPIKDSRERDLLRAYSIVSAPWEEYLELFVELVHELEDGSGGKLTPLLHRLKEGDSVDLLPKAKGIFMFDPKYRNHVMVATVTGVVPYVSILRDYKDGELGKAGYTGHRIFILHGASYWDELVYGGELRLAQVVRPEGLDIFYIPTVSRPDKQRNSGWDGETGRVNLLVERYLAKWQDKWQLSQENTLVYVCGHPGMIEYVKGRLQPNGWDIKEEAFFTQ